MFDKFGWGVLLVGFPLGLLWGVPAGLWARRAYYHTFQLPQASWNKKKRVVLSQPGAK